MKRMRHAFTNKEILIEKRNRSPDMKTIETDGITYIDLIPYGTAEWYYGISYMNLRNAFYTITELPYIAFNIFNHGAGERACSFF